MYAITNGIINETYIIVFKVNRLDDAFLIVKELWRSNRDG
jgi:hypothetical protein